MVKNPPAKWETQVQSLGQEDPLKKEMAINSMIPVWENPDRLQSSSVQFSLSVMSDSLTPWTVDYQDPPSTEFSSKSIGVGGHFLLQRIFPTQGSNPCLPHCRQTLYPLREVLKINIIVILYINEIISFGL